MWSYNFRPSSMAGALMLLAIQTVHAVPYATATGVRHYTNSSTTAFHPYPTDTHTVIGLMDIEPNMPHDPDAQCQFWWDNDGSISCKEMPKAFKISLEDWLRWNPSLTKDCGNYITGRSYCIEGPEGPQSTTTTPPPLTTTDPTAVVTPSPIQSGMVKNCNKFHKVEKSQTCNDIASKFGISEDDVKKWNPEVGSDCTGIWANVYVCIGVIGGSAPTPSSTTTTTGNGVSTPLPTQTGMVNNCSHFYKVHEGETCKYIAEYHSIPLEDIIKWNPAVGPDCTDIWAGTWLCWQTIGYVRPKPTTTKNTSPTSPETGVVTPSPFQPGMIKNCEKFHYVEKGQTCAWIAAKYGIAPSRLEEWHTSITNGCDGLWANSNVCVRPQGYKPSTKLQCFNDGWAWGDNYQAAWDSVKQWCDGKDNSDGSYGYQPGQVKYGCFNTPIGSHTIRWMGRNDFGSGASLEPSTCEGMLYYLLQSCPKGGKSWFEGWYIEGSVPQGRCS
ncbi:hypothetical protein FPOAC2_12938 [Fusarium poae]|uniref:hypothetical protein n=1 Tax=Fusarium poae TaxID=36050 RepID=UPI001CE97404|nr:hypothetical protein FPOAC1_012587 [Fusarium poae]KAG8667748.1 hypothetical protein FPOAC1_012587 [Fusarium poae]